MYPVNLGLSPALFLQESNQTIIIDNTSYSESF